MADQQLGAVGGLVLLGLRTMLPPLERIGVVVISSDAPPTVLGVPSRGGSSCSLLGSEEGDNLVIHVDAVFRGLCVRH